MMLSLVVIGLLELCSTGLEDDPDAAVRFPALNQCSIFAASLVNAIHITRLLLFSKFHFLGSCIFEFLQVLMLRCQWMTEVTEPTVTTNMHKRRSLVLSFLLIGGSSIFSVK